MKHAVVFLLLVLSANLFAQETAQVSITCTSLRFPPATGGPGQAQTLSFTTDPTGEINNEFAPLNDPSLPGYGSLFILDDPTTAGSLTGQVFFDPPPQTDANADGFDDFLQLAQPVGPVSTSGIFKTPVDEGTVNATWSRAAGSPTGTCTVQLTGKAFGQLPAFTVNFELLTYSGTLTYTPTTNSVTGFLSLTNALSVSNVISGPVSLVRVSTNRLDQLTLLPNVLTNLSGQSLGYSVDIIQRDTQLKTNYFGYLVFADGDPSTGTSVFQDWILSIDDPNDANGNGIPDLSDDVGSVGPEQPSLHLSRAGGQLLLSISGAARQSVQVQSSPSLPGTNWTQALSLTVTNDPQSVSLPLPIGPTAFWRLKSQ